MGLFLTIAATTFLLATICSSCLVQGSTPKVPADYVEYFRGDPDSRIILVSGHGGALNPGNVSARIDGCSPTNVKKECVFNKDASCASREYCRVVTKADAFTVELMKRAAETVGNITGLKPSYVVNHMARKYLDVNRGIEEAAMGDPFAERVYNQFHQSVEDAKARVKGRGLLIDVHGYSSHPHKLIELGYLVSPSDLDAGNIDPDKTSLRSLLSNCVCECGCGDDVSTGIRLLNHPVKSLGAILQDEGYHSIPSPANPSPAGRKYYRGGHITRHHGSRYNGTVDAIQMEAPPDLRWNADNRNRFAEALGRSIARFYRINYNPC